MNETEKHNENIHKTRLKLREKWAEAIEDINTCCTKVDKFLEEMLLK